MVLPIIAGAAMRMAAKKAITSNAVKFTSAKMAERGLAIVEGGLSKEGNQENNSSNIYPLVTSTPEEIEQRKKDLEKVVGSPANDDFFENSSEQNVGKKFADNLDFTKLKNKEIDLVKIKNKLENGQELSFEELELLKDEDRQNYLRALENLQTDNDNEQKQKLMNIMMENYLQAINAEIENIENQKKQKIKRIGTELKANGLHFSDTEIEELIKSNFKVKFPIGVSMLYVFKLFSNIVLTLISSTLMIIGLVTTAVGVGVVLDIVGIILFIFSIVINTTFFLTMFAFQNYYLKNASDILKKTSFARRFIYKKVARRFWIYFFGSVIPLISIITDFSMIIMTYLHIKKIVKKVKIIVEKNV